MRDLRPAEPRDAHVAALLQNATSEPHFSITAQKLTHIFAQERHGYAVSEAAGVLTGLSSCWLPEFHPTHAWIGLHLHPDALGDGTAAAHLTWHAGEAEQAGRTHLWLSVREDYQPTWPDVEALGFREVHRTFGGGFHLQHRGVDGAALETRLAAQGYRLEAAAANQHDARLQGLYELTCGDKVSAPPTIPLASAELSDEDALWEAAVLAWQGEDLVGLALPERSRLEAWNAVLIVHPGHRRRGLGTALQVRVARAVQKGGRAFLNTAGSARDAAYLGVLRRSGANIEPDWIAYDRSIAGLG
ncbi:GNAT family N-acetyltransferase [Deinococcus koreensis]|uniref:GNAT family N-acetyltransferase n=1 Tax=Deinococcus koreensis TaxID=2054903 RepID=A0A2K3UXQ7_9DEIO|nr:GNAT family N-acetyltransferase [Deinococcus koreensis]PNY81295.1 GNAT family N-acetyltransferase [Deinococcus koreensis]